MLRSLRSQLLLVFTLIAILPLAVALGIAYVSTRNLLETELEKSLRSIATRQSAQLNRLTQERISEVELLAQLPAVLNAFDGSVTAELDAYIRTVVAQRQYTNLFLVGRDGRVQFTAEETPERDSNLRQQFRETELTRVFERSVTILETEFSDFRIHPPTGRPSAFIATPVIARGKVVGVLAVEMGPGAALAGVDDFTGLGATGETLIVVRDGEDALFVSPTRKDPTAGFRVRVPLESSEGFLFARALDGDRSSGHAYDQNGTRVFATWRYLPAMGFGVVVKIDRAEAFAAVDKLAALFGVILLLVGMSAWAIALMMARRMVQPLEVLREATQHLAAGDFTVVVRTSGTEEVESLAADFRRMTTNLSDTFTQLREVTAEREKAAQEAIAAKQAVEEINSTLEQKVLDRTRELVDKNATLEEALAENRRSQQQLIAQEKMASLGQLTSGIAHEISNPLNFVNNFSDLSTELLVDLEAVGERSAPRIDPRDREELLDLLPTLMDNMNKIRMHGRRAEAIVKNMLDHTRTSGSTRAPSDVNGLVRDSQRTCYQSMRSRKASLDVDFLLELDTTLPPVSMHGSEILRALNNIMLNAIWAVDQRRTKEGPSYTPLVELRTSLDDGFIRIAMRDNGIGIPEANRGQLFRPFFTTKPTGQGVGLGLSLAWEVIVNQHHGKLEVNSREGSWSEFIVKLPVKYQGHLIATPESSD